MTEPVAGPEFKDRVWRTLSGRQRTAYSNGEFIRAGVLLILFEKDGEWHVLFTKRTTDVGSHKGQVSFPGGASKQYDDSALSTALRETAEEIGVHPEDLDILGELDDNITVVTRYLITPFVAVIPYPYPFRTNPREVEELVEVPISFLLDRGNFWEEVELRDFGPHVVHYWDYHGTIIWGATSRILKQFLDVIFGEEWGQRPDERSAMPLVFRKERHETRFLDPRNELRETILTFEVRTAPLTRQQCRIVPYRFVRPPEPDLSTLMEDSLKTACPFCPGGLERLTPKFPPDIIPEGRLSRGECTVVPNAAPYATYGAVAPICHEHYVALDGFQAELLANAFLACQEYLRRVRAHDPKARHQTISWNYMPPAGRSILHPHLQVEASAYPSQYQGHLMDLCRIYHARNLSNYWEDLVALERDLGERYIATTGSVIWLTPFVPRGTLLEVQAIFREKDSILSLSEDELAEFAEGLCRVLRYIHELGWYSFNMALYSGIAGEEHVWSHARIVARTTFPPLGTSDHFHIPVLQDEYCVLRPPEEVAAELRPYFEGSA